MVASEVPKLAERSRKAAVEISDVSKRSVTVAENAGKTIVEVVDDIRKAAELVQEITASSNEEGQHRPGLSGPQSPSSHGETHPVRIDPPAKRWSGTTGITLAKTSSDLPRINLAEDDFEEY